MKKIVIVIVVVLVTVTMFGQVVVGKWNGALDIQGTQLRVVFNISKTESGYSATMDSPDQGVNGIAVSSVSYENSALKLFVSKLGIEYYGVLGEDNIVVGTFKQGGQSFLLNLSKKEIKKKKMVRPQEPIKPYSYYSENVKFKNEEDNIVLAGTLTMPNKKGNFTVVVLISGSGPQNRNEEIAGHKPFLVLADYLTKNGIAVLRFDDRGTAKSTGSFKNSTTFDFAKDVESAIKYLKNRTEINKNKIGLLGHSEGGIVASIVASKNKDVDFVVLMASPALRA